VNVRGIVTEYAYVNVSDDTREADATAIRREMQSIAVYHKVDG
jgi:hypothetical protein